MRKASKKSRGKEKNYGNPETLGKEAWGVERGFVYSHVQAVYYNWKKKVLLKDKLDEMDKIIDEHATAIAEKLVTNEKFAETLANYVTKAMITGQDVNEMDKVPNSAFVHTLAQKITENQTAISALNSSLITVHKPNPYTGGGDPRCKDIKGGYIIVGKIVIVSLSFTISRVVSCYLKDLPQVDIGGGDRGVAVAVSLYHNDTERTEPLYQKEQYIRTDGILYVWSEGIAAIGDELFVSGVYITK